ncbi:hypothetical protein [uncultured Rhodoblastus sp.]|uniref:hypothetical protein n=1 Tax=uncultured Rhodoblastus sp. TaxID=543037 RepID=UPI0025FBF803|nr:hypothetical protein [uncultured Rhodoblastus sp.]
MCARDKKPAKAQTEQDDRARHRDQEPASSEAVGEKAGHVDEGGEKHHGDELENEKRTVVDPEQAQFDLADGWRKLTLRSGLFHFVLAIVLISAAALPLRSQTDQRLTTPIGVQTPRRFTPSRQTRGNPLQTKPGRTPPIVAGNCSDTRGQL